MQEMLLHELARARHEDFQREADRDRRARQARRARRARTAAPSERRLLFVRRLLSRPRQA